MWKGFMAIRKKGENDDGGQCRLIRRALGFLSVFEHLLCRDIRSSSIAMPFFQIILIQILRTKPSLFTCSKSVHCRAGCPVLGTATAQQPAM
jgi:hypothetical protein